MCKSIFGRFLFPAGWNDLFRLACAVLLGGYAQVFSYVLAKEGQVGKVQFVGYLFDVFLGLLQQILDVLDYVMVDNLGGRLAADFLAYGGQVFGSDVETGSVV